MRSIISSAKLTVLSMALGALEFAQQGTSTVVGKTAGGGNLRRVDLSKMQVGVRSKVLATSPGNEKPLPRPVVSVGQEEVNGEDLTVLNIKLFGRPTIITDKDAFRIEKDADGKSQKVLTGEKTLMLRLADTRSGVPMMQQLVDQESGELINDRVTFTLPHPAISEAEFDADNPNHWAVFEGVIQARAYGKLSSDVVRRQRKTGEAGFEASGKGQTAATTTQGNEQRANQATA